MARKNKTDDQSPVEGQPAPELAPKVGDKINYIFAEHTGPYAGQVKPAIVTIIHPGADARVIDLEVATDTEILRIGPTPYRNAAEQAGNTWHWPEETAA